MLYAFECYTFDPGRRELRRDGEVMTVEPMVLDVLEFLIRHREGIVSKDDLVTGVWNRRFISESTVSSRMTEVRCAIGDNGREQRVIRTYSRRGFRFIAAVREEPSGSVNYRIDAVRERLVSSNLSTAFPQRADHRIPKLSIVVLPFTNLSQADHDHIADGLTTDLISALARSIRGSFVIARSTAFIYKNKSIDARQVGRELGVRYMLEGNIRTTASALKVGIRLIDAESGAVLWADHLNGNLGDLDSLNEQIVARLARTLSLTLVELEARKTKQAIDPDAADLILRGRAAYYSPVAGSDAYAIRLSAARTSYQSAIALAPEAVDALAGVALVELVETSIFRPANFRQRFAHAEQMINRALDIDSNHALARYTRAYLFSVTNRLETAREEALIAITLDASLMEAYQRLAMIEILSGRPKQALEWLEREQLLSPLDPNSIYREVTRAEAYLLLGCDETVVSICQRAVRLGHRPPYVYWKLIAALSHLGRKDEAQAAMADLSRTSPGLATVGAIQNDTRSQHPNYLKLRKRMYDGLRKAGMPA